MIGLQTWDDFCQFVGDLKYHQLDSTYLNTKVKFPKNEIMNFDEVSQYFRKEFQITRTDKRSKWHKKDKYLLIWCVSKLVEKLQTDFISLESKGVFQILSPIFQLSKDFLRKKWLSLSKYCLKENPWTLQEDQLLIELKNKYPGNSKWTEIAEEFILKTQTMRYQKQIRERYNNVINPSIDKNPPSKDEVMTILKLAQENNKNWAGISKNIQGRTDNKIKNIYNSVLKKIKKKLENKNLKYSEKQILCLIEKFNTFDPDEFFTQIERLPYQETQVAQNIHSSSQTSNSQLPQQYAQAIQHPIPIYPQPNPYCIWLYHQCPIQQLQYPQLRLYPFTI